MKLNARFQRVVVTRDEALAMFQENRFKVEIISGLPQDAVISLYRCTAHTLLLCACPGQKGRSAGKLTTLSLVCVAETMLAV